MNRFSSNTQRKAESKRGRLGLPNHKFISNRYVLKKVGDPDECN